QGERVIKEELPVDFCRGASGEMEWEGKYRKEGKEGEAKEGMEGERKWWREGREKWGKKMEG
ncbi:leukotoxin-activating lysine-acyltransferase LktC, partial [Escherichia coli]